MIAGETAVITKREQRILFSEALLVSIIVFKYLKKVNRTKILNLKI